MKKNVILVIIVAIFGFVFLGIGVYNYVFTSSSDDSKEKDNVMNRSITTPIKEDGHIEGVVDTVDEYKYILENTEPPKNFIYQYASETEITITFNKVDNKNNKIIGAYEMDKDTFEISSVDIKGEDSE